MSLVLAGRVRSLNSDMVSWFNQLNDALKIRGFCLVAHSLLWGQPHVGYRVITTHRTNPLVSNF